MSNEYKLSKKYKDFIKYNAPVECLEGTTAAGKTTVGILKFMLQVAKSKKKQHVIAAKTTGVAEKNIIQKEYGITDVFGEFVKYNGNGDKDDKIPHIRYSTPNGEKVIYILGYDNKEKWKMALGSQFGCVLIDEVNTANVEFVREISTRNDYLMMTLNPDDPNLPIYKEFINCARPLEKYRDDVPVEILEQLNSEEKPNWTYWFFSFYDNASLSEEDIEKKKLSAPKGTKLYKNKILGLRGRATGIIFSNFERKNHVVSKEYAKGFIRDRSNKLQIEWFEIFSAGLDTAYSSNSPDTISMSFIGITNKGNCFILDEKVYNNANLDTPIAPSDTVKNFIDFLERNRKEWGFAKDVFIDSADQATITEFAKYKRLNGTVYNFNNAWKKTTIIDRINLQLGWFAHNQYKILNHCANYISELETYSWMEDKDNTPEDANDHMVNSTQYSWLPYKNRIGISNNL
ncbi:MULTISPECIES: terminase large subunit domain-containing protein [Clostridium]|uniref:terminase large subunit domain-containing protein n=1 Tax=Clostridium TaxID=1485 RepID=UPI0032EF1BE6